MIVYRLSKEQYKNDLSEKAGGMYYLNHYNQKNYSSYLLLLVCFITASTFLSAQTQKLKRFALKGTISGEAAGFVRLRYLGHTNTLTADSCVLTNGGFSFQGLLSGPSTAWIEHNGNNKMIFLEPSPMTFTANKDWNNVKVSGSKTQNDYQVLDTELQKIQSRWKIVIDTLAAVNKRSNVAYQELRHWVLKPYFEEVSEATYKFYTQYPTSFATAYSLQLTARDLPVDSLKIFYKRFPAEVKQSQYGKNVYKIIEERNIGVVNTMAASFSKSDINGNVLRLSDFRGKYVLLDFWGSWCVPCRKGNPHLRELYSKYQSLGIEFIGIAADDNTQDAWKKAITQDSLPWLHILQGNEPETDVARKYNIIYYPTKILIDQQGKIIGRYGSETAALDKALASIFNK